MKLIFLLTTFVFLAACSRDNNGQSSLIIQLPDNAKSINKKISSLAFQDEVPKVCYAINVVGGGIPAGSSSCGPAPGVYSAFMPAGSQLELLVPTGTGRTVELYMLALNSASDTCPGWNHACDSKFNCGVYKVGQTANVDMSQSETIVDIQLNFKTWNDNVVKTSTLPNLCAGKVEAALNSTGNIKDQNQADLFTSYSHPTNESIAYDKFYLTAFSNAGIVNNDATFKVAPFIRSVTQKPDSKLYYGLVGQGQVVQVFNNGTFKYLDAGGCPFSTCKVPPWMAGISAGLSRNLYGVDHSGNIYRFITGSQIEQFSHKVPPYVQHLANF